MTETKPNGFTDVRVQTVICACVAAFIASILGHNSVALVGALIAGMSLIEIDVPWGGTLPAALGVLVVGAVLLPTRTFAAAVGVAYIAIALPWLASAAKRTTQLRLLTFAIDMAVAVGTATVLRHNHTFASVNHHRVSGASVVFVGVVGLVLGIADYATRFRPLSPTKYSLKHVAQMYAALVCEAAFVVLGWQLHNWLAFSTGLVMGAMTWYFCRNYRIASATHEQSVMAVGLLPEVAGFSPVGHGERCGVYAEVLAERLGFGPIDREHIRTAARVMRIGYVHFPEPEAIANGMEVPSREELADATERVLSQASFLADVEPLVRDALLHDGPDISLDAAILRVISSFDDFVAEERESAPLASMRMLELFTTGPTRRVSIALAELVAEQPDIVDRAQEVARPMFDAAAQARADITGE